MTRHHSISEERAAELQAAADHWRNLARQEAESDVIQSVKVVRCDMYERTAEALEFTILTGQAILPHSVR